MKYKRVITLYSNEPIPDFALPDIPHKIEDIDTDKQLNAKSRMCKLPKTGPKILIYQRVEYIIGGIETWGYNLAKTFKKKDITFVFRHADREQVERLSKYANVIIDDDKREYECDIFISANYDGNSQILDRVKAKKYYQTIHSDFSSLKQIKSWKDFKLDIDKRYQIIAASETAHNGIKKLGYDSIIAKNPLASIDRERPLILLSMTRASIEKGLARMAKMMDELDRKHIKYLWLLASTIDMNDQPRIAEKIKNNKNVVIIPPSVRNEQLYWLADYCVQLSDTEAYCYTIRSALQHYCPVIATRFPEAEKIIKDGDNGYLLDFDLSNLDVVKMQREMLTPWDEYYEPVDENWEKILSL